MPEKDLSTRIAENVTHNRASKAARNTAAFLALRGEINKALNDGWAILQIWETLYQEGKIRFGYAAFCRRVKRSMLSGKATVAGLENKTADAKAARTVKPSITGFTFESTPRKEDLL
ncbi:TraK family protein [Nitrosovibrio sp. Nv4]|nr:TraK family protein [Nitrosovibrio sp. Nv4]